MKNLKYEYIKHLTGTVQDSLGPLCSNGLWLAEITIPASASTFTVRYATAGVGIVPSLAAMVTAGEYDLGIAFDGDADRCLMIDEKGNVVDGDKTMAVCGKYMRDQGLLTGRTKLQCSQLSVASGSVISKNGVTGLLATDTVAVLQHFLQHIPDSCHGRGKNRGAGRGMRRASGWFGEITKILKIWFTKF